MKVNTDAIRNLAQNIDRISRNQKKDFDEMKNEINKLSKTWNSKAGRNSSNDFQKCLTMESQRFQIINNTVLLLRKEISEGSERTEGDNISLGERFK